MTTAFFYDDIYLRHQPGSMHPERSARLTATMTHLETLDWFQGLTRPDIAIAEPTWLESVHDPAYIDRARLACERGESHLDVPDVGISKESFAVATAAVNAGVSAIDTVIGGAADNAFCLTRPPGHHAEHALALGFCLFNNVAVMARYAQARYGIERVLILDWDVHHGNGTQHTFERDPNVLYVSLHQYPYYPGTGAATEDGEGAGQGATLNCPMPAGAGDQHFVQAFSAQIDAAVDRFAPELVIVSAGFDAHESDPLADLRLTTESYRWMTERVLSYAAKHADNRLVSVLEGGYSLDALPLCVATHLDGLRSA